MMHSTTTPLLTVLTSLFILFLSIHLACGLPVDLAKKTSACGTPIALNKSNLNYLTCSSGTNITVRATDSSGCAAAPAGYNFTLNNILIESPTPDPNFPVTSSSGSLQATCPSEVNRQLLLNLGPAAKPLPTGLMFVITGATLKVES